MRGRWRKSSVMPLIAAGVATVCTLVFGALPAAAATGPFSCNTGGSQECEITASAVLVGSASEIIVATCTAVTVNPVPVAATGVSCYVARLGTTTLVAGCTCLTFTSGQVSTAQVVSPPLPVLPYWVCLQAEGVPSPPLGPNNCSPGPI